MAATFNAVYRMLEINWPGRATSSRGTEYRIEARNGSIVGTYLLKYSIVITRRLSPAVGRAGFQAHPRKGARRKKRTEQQPGAAKATARANPAPSFPSAGAHRTTPVV